MQRIRLTTITIRIILLQAVVAGLHPCMYFKLQVHDVQYVPEPLQEPSVGLRDCIDEDVKWHMAYPIATDPTSVGCSTVH